MSQERGDDYVDFMEKAQAKFKERNEILQNATPSTKERLLRNEKPLELTTSPKDSVDSPVVNKPFCKASNVNENAKQSVKENIRKFEQTPSSIENVKQSVKDNIRKFEQIANTSTPSPTRNFKKIGSAVKVSSPAMSMKVFERISSPAKTSPAKSMKMFERISSPTKTSPAKSMKVFERISSPTKTSPAKSMKLSSPVNSSPVKTIMFENNSVKSPINSPVSLDIEEDERISAELLSPPPKKGKEDEAINTPASSYKSNEPSLGALFDQRLRNTMEPMTPKRARLMDEINEDYQKHSNSLPRQPTRKSIDFNESAEDDSIILSLKEYRQNTLGKQYNDKHNVEQLTYTHLQSVDATDSCASKRKVDRIRQLEEFIKVCQTQYEQAKKALNLTISKPERGEDEFVAANQILLNHRVVLEAALRMRKSLDKKAIVKFPEMRSAFTFHSVEFELKPEFLHGLCIDKSSCYFTVVIGHNETTRCSPHISARENKRCRMSVDIYCAINDVEPGFEIYVEIYMLKIQKPTTEKKNTFVDAVGTLLRGEKQIQRNDEFQRFSQPHFERIGTAKINQSNMRSRHIHAEEISDHISPHFIVQFDHRVMESNHQMEGYLRRYEVVAGVGNWTMEYMTFNKWFLDSWITQRDQLEEKPAIRSTSLRRCLDVGEVSDSACYPHAFYIIYATEEGVEEKLLLAARSKEEHEQWIKVLKSFVDGLKYWN